MSFWYFCMCVIASQHGKKDSKYTQNQQRGNGPQMSIKENVLFKNNK